jgi:hypothetical protein
MEEQEPVCRWPMSYLYVGAASIFRMKHPFNVNGELFLYLLLSCKQRGRYLLLYYSVS